MHHHLNKFVTYLLDAASGTTLLWGWFTGQDALMLLGAMASIAAIINHGSAWWDRHKQKRKNKKQ